MAESYRVESTSEVLMHIEGTGESASVAEERLSPGRGVLSIDLLPESGILLSRISHETLRIDTDSRSYGTVPVQ